MAESFLAGYLALLFVWPGVATIPEHRCSGPSPVGAGWKWLVLLRMPEASIRVDLLVIGSVLLLLSSWSLLRAFR